MRDLDTFIVPNGPVSRADVVDAARMILSLEQKPAYVAWRENRWYDDDLLARRIKEDRHHWFRQRYQTYSLRDHPFDLPVAQDIILAGLPYTPLQTISSLDQMGLHATDSTDDEFADALCLLDRPELFDVLRESGFPLAEVQPALTVLGGERFRLMFEAGMTCAEVLDATYTGTRVDMVTLRTMAALLGPTRTVSPAE